MVVRSGIHVKIQARRETPRLWLVPILCEAGHETSIHARTCIPHNGDGRKALAEAMYARQSLS